MPGTKPSFPSTAVVIRRHVNGAWDDFAFVSDDLEGELEWAEVGLIDGRWHLLYTAKSPEGTGSTHLVVWSSHEPVLPSEWTPLPGFPAPPGRAGLMAGSHGGVLIAAGGANFPDLPPWEGGIKQYYSDVAVLLPGASAWTSADSLGEARGYAAMASLPEGVLLVGGENAERLFSDLLLLRWDGRTVVAERGRWPDLPFPVTSPAAAVVGEYLYVAGGYTPHAPRRSRKEFLRLRLAQADAKWEILPSWPGPARAMAVAAALDDSFYLISGLNMGTDSPPVPAYLRDAFRFHPATGWERLADLPWSTLAAPSPAPVDQAKRLIFVLGGVDGTQVGKLPRDTSLPADILSFSAESGNWSLHPQSWPTPVVTVPATRYNQGWVIVSGEIMPGKRTTEAWLWKPESFSI